MLQHRDHHHNAKTVTSFLIFAVAVLIFIVFYANYDSILQTNFQLFMTLAVVGAGLLIGLLYLVNKPHQSTKTVKAGTKSKSKKKKK